jgi:hypothetical protein
MEIGTKLVVFDKMRDGEPDEYLVVVDEDGNYWSIQPEWLTQIVNGPELVT